MNLYQQFNHIGRLRHYCIINRYKSACRRNFQVVGVIYSGTIGCSPVTNRVARPPVRIYVFERMRLSFSAASIGCIQRDCPILTGAFMTKMSNYFKRDRHTFMGNKVSFL